MDAGRVYQESEIEINMRWGGCKPPLFLTTARNIGSDAAGQIADGHGL